MTTRRDFVAFVGCALMGAAHAQAPRKREVLVRGKRVKTIDVHAHCAVPEAMALVKQKATQPGLVMAMDERLRHMDEQGIDVEALSINPYWYGAEPDVVTEVIRIQNERLAEICARAPERFVAFASV